MITDERIKNSSELEFAVFCIENVAAKLGVNAAERGKPSAAMQGYGEELFICFPANI